MLKKHKKLIIIMFIAIGILSIFSYKYIIPKDEERIKIENLLDIETYKFNSFTKFNNEKIDTITDNDNLIKFKTLFNNLDKSDSIKKVELPKDIELQSFKYYAHVNPNFKYIEENKQTTMKDTAENSEQTTSYAKEQAVDGYFLLSILIDNVDGNSYITFVGTDLSYVLDSNETRTLKEIFIEN